MNGEYQIGYAGYCHGANLSDNPFGPERGAPQDEFNRRDRSRWQCGWLAASIGIAPKDCDRIDANRYDEWKRRNRDLRAAAIRELRRRGTINTCYGRAG